MVRMSSDLTLKKDVELSQAAYLKFHSVFNALRMILPCAVVQVLIALNDAVSLFAGHELGSGVAHQAEIP